MPMTTDLTSLESSLPVTPARGFESHPLRQSMRLEPQKNKSQGNPLRLYFYLFIMDAWWNVWIMWRGNCFGRKADRSNPALGPEVPACLENRPIRFQSPGRSPKTSDNNLDDYTNGDITDFIYELEIKTSTLLKFDVTVIDDSLDALFLQQI